MEGGAGGPGGHAARVVLGFLLQLDLQVPAIGAAECLLAAARVRPRNQIVNELYDAKNNYSVQLDEWASSVNNCSVWNRL